MAKRFTLVTSMEPITSIEDGPTHEMPSNFGVA